MTIAVLSDIHDNIWNLETALHIVQNRDAESILFLGDFCAPFTLAQLAEGFSGPIHIVFGNNDGDQFLLTSKGGEYPHVSIHGHLGQVTLGGRKLALNHYPDLSERLAESGAYDAVFSGHNHLKHLEQRGQGGMTLWANPGEVMGRFGEPSIGFYETQDNSFVHVAVQRP
ncbi:MAG: YfcE family phosphodiesterase [Spirochaetes bacterium]|jgi:putative phosphoesterase|nr:YfcE family phosphodiesterase [Spirochaetota bacterium]